MMIKVSFHGGNVPGSNPTVHGSANVSASLALTAVAQSTCHLATAALPDVPEEGMPGQVHDHTSFTATPENHRPCLLLPPNPNPNPKADPIKPLVPPPGPHPHNRNTKCRVCTTFDSC